MGIMQIIRGQKQQFRRLQQDRSMAHNVAAADELQALKEQRIRLEGKARLSAAQADERGRIQQSQQTLRQNSPVMRGARNLAKFINEGKTVLKKVKGTSTGPGLQFGGKGFNVGGGGSGPFNTKGSNPFDNTKKEKPKTKTITIRVER